MRIIGQTASATAPAVTFPLGHGQDPKIELGRRGYAVRGYQGAALIDGELTVTVRVTPSATTGDVPDHPARREAGLDPDVVPEVRQRIAAYAVVTSVRGVLATQFSNRTGAVGRWGLPGGGIDAGEEPTAAAVREVREETAQEIELGRLWTVQTQHWIGASPDGRAEDYHAVRLIYLAECPEPTDPVVLDVGGTTAAARWIAVERWRELDWAAGSVALLGERLGGPATTND